MSVNILSHITAIMCSSLSSISNGVVTYSPDNTDPFAFGTIATYTCNNGFYLQGLFFAQVCGGNPLIEDWNGSPPSCPGD